MRHLSLLTLSAACGGAAEAPAPDVHERRDLVCEQPPTCPPEVEAVALDDIRAIHRVLQDAYWAASLIQELRGLSVTAASELHERKPSLYLRGQYLQACGRSAMMRRGRSTRRRPPSPSRYGASPSRPPAATPATRRRSA